MADADLLLKWRNDPETVKASITPVKVQETGHLAWLADLLESKNSYQFIAEDNGTPVGTVRQDHRLHASELSWTVAPNFRGKGIGKTIVALLADRIPGPLTAKIKEENTSSIKIAESIGMIFDKKKGGVLFYKRL